MSRDFQGCDLYTTSAFCYKNNFLPFGKPKFRRVLRRRGNSEMHEVIDFFMKSISEASAFAAPQRNV